jgi:hypothetical protein
MCMLVPPAAWCCCCKPRCTAAPLKPPGVPGRLGAVPGRLLDVDLAPLLYCLLCASITSAAATSAQAAMVSSLAGKSPVSVTSLLKDAVRVASWLRPCRAGSWTRPARSTAQHNKAGPERLDNTSAQHLTVTFKGAIKRQEESYHTGPRGVNHCAYESAQGTQQASLTHVTNVSCIPT